MRHALHGCFIWILNEIQVRYYQTDTMDELYFMLALKEPFYEMNSALYIR